MKKLLCHLSFNNKNYSGILKYLSQNTQIDSQILNLHNRAFDTLSQVDADCIVLSLNEYTQELHDLVSSTDKNIILHINTFHKNMSDIIQYLNSKNNISYLTHLTNEQLPIDKIITYTELYDDQIFVNQNTERNDKIAVILSSNNEENNILKSLLYPKTKLKLSLFNNPEFNSAQNVGNLTDVDLAEVLNSFSCVVDVSQQFRLEANACECPYIICDKNLEINIQQKNIEQPIKNLSSLTFKKFIDNTLIKLI